MNDLFSNIEKGNGKAKSNNATKAAAEASGPKLPYREYNGTIEKSKVIYDEFGRQSIRVDFSDHGMPLEHSVPHIHVPGCHQPKDLNLDIIIKRKRFFHE
ncbi:hypothetical protein [Listeria marthii]|uniref:hypothetical protein n=1 Tax=Listeria marthii TaxID=529731 RepID=UPI001888146C|nr:hypothetical protein [Listeria marthii]MBF2537181.1 hypothetical protein [Listeria marthii]